MNTEPRHIQSQMGSSKTGDSAQTAPRPTLTQAEFGERFQGSSRRLWCIAAAVLGDRSRAADAVQEAAVVALSKLPEFDPATNFDSWMGQIVRYVSLNHARQRRRERHGLAEPATFDSHAAAEHPPAGPAVDLRGRPLSGRADFDDALGKALQSVEETARACLLLKTVEGLSYQQISAVLSIPEGTAMSHVHRARKALRQALAPGKGGGVAP